MSDLRAKPRRASPPRQELAPGTTFAGRYRVQRRLGYGGMADVYEVEHTITKRHLALKVLRPEALANPTNAERFFREASVCAGIDSDHIVAITDCDVDSATECPFLVMELLQGSDLAAYVKETHGKGSPIPASLVLTVLRQVASALDKVHAQGIVHRDLKPANLFLSFPSEGPPRVKILDFGIAKHLAEDASNSTGRLGTPLYMAAEQLHGDKTVGPATDVWALGLIAYELLVGAPYWEGNTAAQLVNRLPDPHARPTPSSLAARHHVSLPPAFDRWLLRCIDPDPARRHPSAGVAVSELIAIFDPGATRPPVRDAGAALAPEPIARVNLAPSEDTPLPRGSVPPPAPIAPSIPPPPPGAPSVRPPPPRNPDAETSPGRPSARPSTPLPDDYDDDDPTRAGRILDDAPTKLTAAPPAEPLDDDPPDTPPNWVSRSLPPRTPSGASPASTTPSTPAGPSGPPTSPSLPPSPPPQGPPSRSATTPLPARSASNAPSTAPPTTVTPPEYHADRGVRPLTIALTGLVAATLVASATYVVWRDRTAGPAQGALLPPVDPVWRQPSPEERTTLSAACRAWSASLASRQHADGSFAGLASAPSSGWDTGQQLAALLHASTVCAAVTPELQLRAIQALDQFRFHPGWAGAPAGRHEVRPSTVASAWATLAYGVLADVTRDPNARTRAVTARDTLLAAQPAQGEGAFTFGLGPGASPEVSPYATVMALWALVETESLDPSPRAVAARQSALAWVRRALATPSAGASSPDALHAVPGLVAQATWVVWRARERLHASAPEDATLASAAARELLSRCPPSASPPGACARARDDNAAVSLRPTATSEPVPVVVVWLPWTLLASATLVRDPSSGLAPSERAGLSSVLRWGIAQFEIARPSAAVDPSYVLADHLLAASALLR